MKTPANKHEDEELRESHYDRGSYNAERLTAHRSTMIKSNSPKGKEESNEKNYLGFVTAAISFANTVNIPKHPVASPVNRKKIFFYN